jgi:hypothetical protein
MLTTSNVGAFALVACGAMFAGGIVFCWEKPGITRVIQTAAICRFFLWNIGALKILSINV